jgi:hypothetical protein
MRDFIQLRDMNFPRRSRVKEKDLIEFLYYRKKAEEIMANGEFMSQARQNTETVIAEFLTASEFCRDFTVEFVSNK